MLFERKILKDVKKFLDRSESLILTGPRQAGKTSILIILKKYLEEKNKNCHYFNLEDPKILKLLNKHPFNIFELVPEKKKQYIFLDEIQYLDDPSNFLKLLFDEKRDFLKIIVSGSSNFYIDKKFKDSLAGRKVIFNVFLLDFFEFLDFNQELELKEKLEKKNKSKLILKEKENLENLWNDYILFGGYPELALTRDVEIKKVLLSEIGSSYVKKDISDANIRSKEKYFTLLKILAGQIGELLNSQKLANILNVSHKTIDEYLYVMQKSYHIALVKPFYRNIRKELTKMPKVYFFDSGLRNYLLNDFDKFEGRSDQGQFLENLFFIKFLNSIKNPLDNIKFWRTQDQNEVDFVIEEKNAFEIKVAKKAFNKSKYQKFIDTYPNIKLKVADYDDLKFLDSKKCRKTKD